MSKRLQERGGLFPANLFTPQKWTKNNISKDQESSIRSAQLFQKATISQMVANPLSKDTMEMANTAYSVKYK